MRRNTSLGIGFEHSARNSRSSSSSVSGCAFKSSVDARDERWRTDAIVPSDKREDAVLRVLSR